MFRRKPQVYDQYWFARYHTNNIDHQGTTENMSLRNRVIVAIRVYYYDFEHQSRTQGLLPLVLFRNVTEGFRRSFARSRWILKLHRWKCSSTSSSEPSTSTGERWCACVLCCVWGSISLFLVNQSFGIPQLPEYLVTNNEDEH